MTRIKPYADSAGLRRAGGGYWLVILLFVGCSHAARSSDHPDDSGVAALKRAAITNYAVVISATYEDSLAAAKKLQRAAEAFLAQPSEEGLAAARNAWLAARVPYSQSEAARFYDGPIDQCEGKINSWPIDEHYLDYVAANPNAGIIKDTTNFPVLSRELILALNEKEGKKNISTGFHALEFLLWGQDLSTSGPGNRSWRDYSDGVRNANRRRQYLQIATGLLVENLETVASAWSKGKTGNYRAVFFALDTDAALANILKGLGALSGPELAGERLTTPYETKEQEEEQDCFSDNTCTDMINDALGIQNVYLGRYVDITGRKLKGPGLHDLLLHVDPAFAANLAGQIESAVASARNIPAPFDQAILGTNASPGRIAIKNAINTFQTESDLIAKAAGVLGIRLNL